MITKEIELHHNFNPLSIIDYAMHTYHSTTLYDKTINSVDQESGTGLNTTVLYNKQKNQTWIPPLEGWYNLNIDASSL